MFVHSSNIDKLCLYIVYREIGMFVCMLYECSSTRTCCVHGWHVLPPKIATFLLLTIGYARNSVFVCYLCYCVGIAVVTVCHHLLLTFWRISSTGCKKFTASNIFHQLHKCDSLLQPVAVTYQKVRGRGLSMDHDPLITAAYIGPLVRQLIMIVWRIRGKTIRTVHCCIYTVSQKK